MSRVFKAGALYFAMVFGAGFVLGTIRVLWVAPQLGARAAELAEAPLMLAVSVLAARFVVRRLSVAASVTARLGMGMIALALLLGCEFTVVLWLRGMSIDGYLRNLDPVSGGAYYGLLVVFAVLPLFVPPVARLNAGALKRRHA